MVMYRTLLVLHKNLVAKNGHECVKYKEVVSLSSRKSMP